MSEELAPEAATVRPRGDLTLVESLDGPADLRFIADPDRLLQVVDNLLDNAILRGPTGHSGPAQCHPKRPRRDRHRGH